MLFLGYVLTIRLFVSVSILTVFPPWFLSDRNVVLFSDIILFITSIFIFFLLAVVFFSVRFVCAIFR